MERKIRARFSKGVIKPLEKLELKEGEEVNVTISTTPEIEDTLEALKATAGSWKGTHDPEELKRNIYSDRLIKSRPEPKL